MSGRGERAAQEQTAGMGLVRRFSRPLTYFFDCAPSSCAAGHCFYAVYLVASKVCATAHEPLRADNEGPLSTHTDV
jgi:hypothetical protein